MSTSTSISDAMPSPLDGVTAPQGFRAAGTAAGLKGSGALDLALVVNDGPLAAAAGVFTRNRVQAAPVVWTRRAIADGQLRAVLVNSGGANACTGPEGYRDTVACADQTAKVLQVGQQEVAVCSTGLIGERLPMNQVLPAIERVWASLGTDGGIDAAAAIRTTDTVSKTAARSDRGVVVGGMAKGAGMLAPELATMLAVVTTDAVADSDVLDRVLRIATAASFERLDSDGCLSTNDTVLLMSSGASGVQLAEGDLQVLVNEVCLDLALQMVADAEGATKSIRVDATSAATVEDAVTVARAVARSNLFKCAIHGEDPNWGRVLSAVGTTDAAFEPERLAVAMNGVWVARCGTAADDRSLVDLSNREVVVTIDLGRGHEQASIWTNDLTSGYVHENSAYPS